MFVFPNDFEKLTSGGGPVGVRECWRQLTRWREGV